MKIFKTILSIIQTLLVFVIILIALTTAFSLTQAPNGIRLFTVLSGSMEPAIKTGSVVVVKPKDKYQKNDVITFFANPNVTDLKAKNTTVTHRIIETMDDEGSQTFRTKGDANQSPDAEIVTQRAVLGKVIFNLPYLGRLIAFTKTQLGFVSVIIIPATLIIYSEIISIKNEIKNMIEKRKSDKKSKKQESSKKFKSKEK